MKDILIIANFCSNLSESSNNRFLYLCKELARGRHVELVTSSFSHGEKKQRGPLENEWPFKITLLHEPGYKKNISLQRFASHRAWGKAVKNYLQTRKKPDVIYCAAPSLTAPLEAAEYARKHGIRYIVDIQDLWPEAFKMVFRVPVLSDLIFAPLTWLANRIYKAADEIVAVSDAYVQRALSVNCKCTSGHTVYLGTRLETFDEGAKENEPLYHRPQGELWIGYCGSLSASYDIPTVIRAMQGLKEKGIEALKLIVMGDGTMRPQFAQLAEVCGIDAVFTGKLPYDQMCAQLSQCDIAVNPIKRGSAASIINKHGDYAASGLPVVNSQENPEYRNLIEIYRMGFNCRNEDPGDMAEKLEMLIRDESLRLEMGRNARRCAEEKFDRKTSYRKIIEMITE